jgi:hypothetical protein
MDKLAPAYLATLATQIGSLSAFLGGFAATYLATFLALGHASRAASWAIGSAAIAAVGFVIAVIASTMLVAATHPEAPVGAIALADSARLAMGLSFMVALVALLVSLGASGWTRSRAMGRLTSGAASVGVVVVVLMLTR